jgi:undecaprenyl-diphosphatase
VDQTITPWINAPAGGDEVVDSIVIAATQYGVPLLVLVVMLQ